MRPLQENAPPLLSVHYQDPHDGWEGFLVIDSLINDCAIGGCRMSESVSMTEVKRLARGMTRKNTMLEAGIGGAKTGIRFDPRSPKRRQVLETFFKHIRPIAETMYGFGPDMNTNVKELDEVAAAVGLDWRLGAVAESGQSREARMRYDSGIALPWGPFNVGDVRTGFGAFATALRAVEFLELGASLRVSVQGFGVVGSAAAWSAVQRGHRVTCVSDAGGSYRSDKGHDVSRLLAAKDGPPAHLIDASRLADTTVVGHPDDALFQDCDVLVLAAIPDVITAANVDRVKARIVVEAANIAVSPEAAERLHERGAVVIPDYIASASAMLVAAGLIQGWMSHQNPETLLVQLADKLSSATERALIASRRQDAPIVRAYSPKMGVHTAS